MRCTMMCVPAGPGCRCAAYCASVLTTLHCSHLNSTRNRASVTHEHPSCIHEPASIVQRERHAVCVCAAGGCQAAGGMPGLLENKQAFSVQSLKRPSVLLSICVVVTLFVVFADSLRLLHRELGHALPIYVFPFLPLYFLTVLSVALPLLVFISYEQEFPQPFNPFKPRNFWHLCQRTVAAINQGKIKSKDV